MRGVLFSLEGMQLLHCRQFWHFSEEEYAMSSTLTRARSSRKTNHAGAGNGREVNISTKGGEEQQSQLAAVVAEKRHDLPRYRFTRKEQWVDVCDEFKRELLNLFRGENGIIQQVSRCFVYVDTIPEKLHSFFKKKAAWRSFYRRFNDFIKQFKAWCETYQVKPAF